MEANGLNYEIITDIEQGSEEWLDMRRGVITGTRLKDIMGTADKRYKTIYEVVGEMLVAPKQISGVPAMERGKALEPVIKRAFPLFSEVGFIKSTKNPFIGLSPDGVFFPNAESQEITEALEIKAPEIKNFLTYWVEKCVSESEELSANKLFKKLPKYKIPDDYLWQVTHYFIVIDTLKELTFAFGNPDVCSSDHEVNFIKVTREDLEGPIAEAQENIKKFFEDVELIKKIFINNSSMIELPKDEAENDWELAEEIL